MAKVKLPFINNLDVESDELGGASPNAVNVVTNSKGGLQRRPGISASKYATSEAIAGGGAVVGLHRTAFGTLFAVSELGQARQVSAVTPTGQQLVRDSGGQPVLAQGTNRPQFSETERLLVLTTGGVPVKVDLIETTGGELGGAPPPCTHVIASGARLVINDTLNYSYVHFSDVATGILSYAGHETWSLGAGTAGIFTAEARPDRVVALAENLTEVFVFGTSSVQAFARDDAFVFVPSVSIDYGCLAPYSIIKVDQEFAWLDQRRRVVLSDMREVAEISAPVQDLIDGLETVADCFGYRVYSGKADCLVWAFPSGRLTLAYQKDVGWSRWAWRIPGTQRDAEMPITSAHMVGSETVVGLDDGRIGQFDPAATTDFGEPIKAIVVTGFLDLDSDKLKVAKSLRIVVRKGPGAHGEVAFIRWRDRPGDWCGAIPVYLDATLGTECEVTYRTLGVFRRRQWQFEFSGASDIMLVEAVLEYDTLED